MIKKISESRITYILLSLVIAIGLWVYVVWVGNPDTTRTYYSVPISFEGESLLSERGLVITSYSPTGISVKLMGKQRALFSLEKEDIFVTALVGNITEPGEYTLPCETSVSTESLYSGISVVGGSTTRVTVTVERLVTKSLEVKSNVTANSAQGYQMGTIQISPAMVDIQGSESEVNKVSYAQVNVSGDNLTATLTVEAPIQLFDAQGELLTDVDVKKSAETAQVTVPIVVLKEIELSVNVIPGGGISAEDIASGAVTIEMSTSSIYVSGEENALATLDKIVLGDIDLSKIYSSESYDFDIALNDALTNESGESTVTVTVTIEGEYETKTFDVTDISYINAPDGFGVTLVTQTRAVLVRGTTEQLEQVQSHQLRIVADLSDISSAEGRYTVKVKVYLDSNSGAGVVGEYFVVVQLEV